MVKVKLSLCLTKHHAMKTYWGSGGTAPCILDLGTRCRWMPLYPQGKHHRYPQDKRLGGPQCRSGRGSEEKNSQPLPGIELQNPENPARSPALYRRGRSQSQRTTPALRTPRNITTARLLAEMQFVDSWVT
jgi:hypothetical protein